MGLIAILKKTCERLLFKYQIIFEQKQPSTTSDYESEIGRHAIKKGCQQNSGPILGFLQNGLFDMHHPGEGCLPLTAPA